MRLALGISLLVAFSTSVSAQDATCEDQAAYFLDAMPGIAEQAGTRTAAEFMEYDTRLLLAVVGFSASADVLGERAVDRGLPREYWLGLLVVSHGLLDCFEDATDTLTESQMTSLQQFDEIYTPDIRLRFATQAAAELGIVGGSE